MTRNKNYTKEFKEGAIALVEEGLSQSEVARRLGIPAKNISRWLQAHKKRKGKDSSEISSVDLVERNKQLEKEIKQLKMEREILKKAAAFFANDS